MHQHNLELDQAEKGIDRSYQSLKLLVTQKFNFFVGYPP